MVSPFDHFQPFRLIVTVRLPFEYTGAAASESALFSWIWPPSAKKYSGRYRSQLKYCWLGTVKVCGPSIGKMKVGPPAAGRAKLAVPDPCWGRTECADASVAVIPTPSATVVTAKAPMPARTAIGRFRIVAIAPSLS